MDLKLDLCLSLSLQDVVSHSKKLTKKNKEQLSDMMMLNKQRGGLKALSKEKREKLEAYQHLFYLLQVSSSPKVAFKAFDSYLPWRLLCLESVDTCALCFRPTSCPGLYGSEC